MPPDPRTMVYGIAVIYLAWIVLLSLFLGGVMGYGLHVVRNPVVTITPDGTKIIDNDPSRWEVTADDCVSITPR